MTLTQMASAIRNHVVDGLKGVTAEAFSKDQIIQEIILESSALIEQAILARTLRVENIAQRIDGIELICTDISSNCEIDAQIDAPRVFIPRLATLLDKSSAIQYVGTMDNMNNFKVYSDEEYKYHKYNLATSKRPYVWLNTSGIDGKYSLHFFNLGNYSNLKFVSVSAVFENPYELLNTEYADQFKSSEFYAPAAIQTAVIATLTQRYVTYYRQLNAMNEPTTLEKN